MPTYNNKVVLRNGTVVLDVTPTTAVESDVASGKIFVKADGSLGTGTASGGDNVFVITLSWDSQENMYMPDCTYAQAYAAYQAGKTIVFEAGDYVPCFGLYSTTDSCFSYGLYEYIDSPTPTYHWGLKTYGYFWTSEGVELDDNQIVYSMDGATATAAEIASGSYAFISSGLATGTATRRDSTSLSVSGATVTAPAGYYASSASTSVASGTAGTPTATKGAVSNHAVTVTPSVTNTAGYISGGTETGTAVSVSASELVSGTYTVDSSGTKDVTNYASASVPAGTAGTPTATKGTVSNHSVTVTPKVTNVAGFISGGTKTGTGVSVTAAELVSDRLPISANGSYDVTNYEEVLVSVQGGSGIGTLLATKSLGTISTSSTQASDTGQTVSVTGINSYDLLIVETSVNSVTNNRHTATVGMILLTASSTVGTKNGATVCSNKWNSKISSAGVTTTRQGTTSYGIYPNSCTISSGNATIAMYQRYNSTNTGTINGSYTTRVYGVKLYDLIGG